MKNLDIEMNDALCLRRDALCCWCNNTHFGGAAFPIMVGRDIDMVMLPIMRATTESVVDIVSGVVWCDPINLMT